jgi:hypothetical protein
MFRSPDSFTVGWVNVAFADGDAVVVVVGWGATSFGRCNADAAGGAGAACADAAGGAVATSLTASGGAFAPASGGAFDSVAASSGGGGVVCNGGIVAAVPTSAAIAALDSIGGGAIVILVGVATAGSDEIAVDVFRGIGEGGKVVDSGTVGDGCDWRDVRRDGAKGSVVVKHDRDGGGSDPNEAAHFVGGAEDGAAEVVGVVEDGYPLLVVRREEKAEGLDKLCHFFAEARLKIHRADETGDVAVASLVHRGDRGKERFPGGVEVHGFISYKS